MLLVMFELTPALSHVLHLAVKVEAGGVTLEVGSDQDTLLVKIACGEVITCIILAS